METRHPVERPFGREFSEFVIIAELRRPEVARLEILRSLFAFCLKNDPSETVPTVCIANKICQGQSPTSGLHCSRSHPNWFTFGRVIAEPV